MRTDEFYRFLTREYCGERSCLPLQKRAANDALSRCRRIQDTLELNLDDKLDGRSSGIEKLISKIELKAHLFNINGDERKGIVSLKNAAKRYNDPISRDGEA